VRRERYHERAKELGTTHYETSGIKHAYHSRKSNVRCDCLDCLDCLECLAAQECLECLDAEPRTQNREPPIIAIFPTIGHLRMVDN